MTELTLFPPSGYSPRRQQVEAQASRLDALISELDLLVKDNQSERDRRSRIAQRLECAREDLRAMREEHSESLPR